MRSIIISRLRPQKSSSRSFSFSYFSSSTAAFTPSNENIVEILPEVRVALSTNRPVVALESTILSHGLPYPENKQLSNDISNIIRSRGAVPATIAVKDGICKVGLTEEEIDDLVVSGMEGRARKCSTRDLPFMLAKRQKSTMDMDTKVKHQWGGG